MSILNYDNYSKDLVTMKIIDEKYEDKFGELARVIVTYIFYCVKKMREDNPEKYKDGTVDYLLREYHAKYCKESYDNIYFHEIYKSLKEKGNESIINENNNLYNYFIDLYQLDDFKNILNNYLNLNFQRNARQFDEYKADDLAIKMLNVEKDDSILYLYEDGWKTIVELLNHKDAKLDIIINLKKIIGEKIEIIKLGYMSREYLEGYTNLKIFSEINNLNVKIIDDAKTLLKDENEIKYNKIYCEARGQKQKESIPIEDLLVRKCLDENGIAVKLLLNNDLDNPDYRHTREDDLNDNKLRAVIAIPADIRNNLYSSTTLNSILLYDSSKEQNEVLFVNAIDECKEKKDEMVFTEKNINNIINCINGEQVPENSKISESLVPYSEIKSKPKEILFSPFNYVEPSVNGKPAIYLEDIAEEIYRGSEGVRVQVQKQQEEETQEEIEDSVYRSITYADLTTGVENYTTKVNGRNLDKYVLNNNDLLINKNGMTTNIFIFKASNDENIKVVPDSNLIAIKIKDEAANAIFLRAYLQSKTGMKMITNIAQSGSVLRSINIKKLGKVPIPKVSRSEQDKYAELRERKTEEIKSLKAELEKLDETYF